ncbi:MAG: TonB-dependent receptor [Lutibacter sp. BRH_c52]|nr:MAG: TonB-dependent receptor [Lutibacter sp. BRH_c52]
MKKIVFLFILSIITLSLGAANTDPLEKISLTGKVIDKDTKQPLEYATIVIKSLDGKIITGGITDTKGEFNIQVVKGVYDISIEFISFKTKTFKSKEISGNTDLGTITLEVDAQTLNEVVVVAEKSTVEIRLDKKIYNVGKDMTVKGGTASDVLDNVPSVSVDVEGKVSLRGNENVRILINGKPSGLVGMSSTDALRQLPADAIEKVEVITSPSARYDAEGTAGILNIILRKGKANGFNGSVSASAGIPDNYGLAANLNYRTNKANFFGSGGYNYRNAPGNSKSDVTYLNPSGFTPDYRNERREYDRKNDGYNARFGTEYFLTDKTSLTGTILYRESDGEDISTNISKEYDENKILTGTGYRVEVENEIDKTTEYSFNFMHDFDKNGHKLTLDFQYEESIENNSALISDTNPERNSTDNNSKDVLIKGDYVLPIGENSQFEFGFNTNLNKLSSDYLVEEYDSSTNQFVNKTNFSNNLDFEQNIYSLYSQYGNKVNKFSYLLGLRMENTDRKINLLQTNENYDKNWTEFFPTVNLGLEFSEGESLTLGYSRRLRRPGHWFLNPFESRTSLTFIRKGNVNLDPTYTNSFDLGYLKKWEKLTLNSSLYYQHAINNIEMAQNDEIREVNGVPTPVIIMNPINLSSQDRYGFEFTANYNPIKWWKITNSFNFFKSVTDGDFNGVNYDKENVSWFTRLESRISLPGGIDWQTSGMYMGPSESATAKIKGMYNVNLAFSKDILKEKGTLALNVSDLFNSRKRNSTNYSPSISSPTTISVNEFQWRQRQVMLNFTYRFNEKKKPQRQQREENGGEEGMF